MRDPNRLYGFYKELRKIHAERFPDWRFGQLCSNFFAWLYERGIDPFFPEEDRMLQYLREYAGAGESREQDEDKNFVYVLYTYWDSEYNEGNEVLGVYSPERLEQAREDMRDAAERLKAEYEPDIWQEDYTWEVEDEIHLGFDPHQAFKNATYYCWTIERREVI